MDSIMIEWRHFDQDDRTCLRCSETGKTLQQVIADLNKELEPKGIMISLVEQRLTDKQIKQSNMILINDVPLESILSDVEVDENYCDSCTCLTGKRTYCRTVVYKGRTFEEIPEKLIRLAVFKILKKIKGDINEK